MVNDSYCTLEKGACLIFVVQFLQTHLAYDDVFLENVKARTLVSEYVRGGILMQGLAGVANGMADVVQTVSQQLLLGVPLAHKCLEFCQATIIGIYIFEKQSKLFFAC